MSSGNGNHKVAELPKLLSADDLADLMDISGAGVRYRRKHGLSLPPGHIVAGRWVYCRRDVEEWMREQRASSA
jgi:hypothetical protein